MQFSVHKDKPKWKDFLAFFKAECAPVLCSPFNASACSPGCSVAIARGSTLQQDSADFGGLASEPDSMILLGPEPQAPQRTGTRCRGNYSESDAGTPVARC